MFDRGVDARERLPVAQTRVATWTAAPVEPELWTVTTADDLLAVEEPLEIRLAGWRVAVTMRTPGDDFDLVAGFLITEGILPDPGAIASIHHCPSDDEESAGNIVNVNPSDPDSVDPDRWQRHFLATSSCGICGKRSIEEVRQRAAPIVAAPPIQPDLLFAMAQTLRAAQTVFRQTGGLHAAALFAPDGCLLTTREDIGRHNAVDKVIGSVLRTGDAAPLSTAVLLVSSRASFEIVQKALMAGIPFVAAVSGASSLAVDLARSAGMTLVGFLREDERRFNVYSGLRGVARRVRGEHGQT